MRPATWAGSGTGLRSAAAALLGTLLARDNTGARMRQAIIAVSLVIYWFALALLADFPRVLPIEFLNRYPFPLNILLDLATSFFAPTVLMHLIPVAAALWLSFRLGVHYLADLFELESISIASRYLGAALFSLNVPHLRIDQGDLGALDLKNPILRIGGPGHVHVHLGFAAVFETIDGRPQVYGPVSGQFIRGFERIRDVIDLRDQLRRVDEVRAITRDGIEVYARDAQMVFRVYGGGRVRTLEEPYPFTDDAVRRLVYGRTIRERSGGKWTDILRGLVASEIRKFVEALTIDEFLALQPDLAEEGQASGSDHAPRPRADRFHIPRRQLTERFHTSEARQRLRESGLELSWVGVGTWELRDPGERGDSDGVGHTLISAWRDLQQARRKSSPEYLRQVRDRRERDLTSRLLRGINETWENGSFGGRFRCWALLTRIQEFILEAQQVLSADPSVQWPPEFPAVIDHLIQLTEIREVGG